MPFHRVFLRRSVTLALAGDDMEELRPFQLADVADGGEQGRQVMTVHGADIIETEFLEQHPRHDHAFQVFLGAP